MPVDAVKKDLFSSSSSSDEDDDLAQQLAAAADRERRRNPHAEEGRAKPPRMHLLQSVKAARNLSAHTPLKASSSDDEAEASVHSNDSNNTPSRKRHTPHSDRNNKHTSRGNSNDDNALRINQAYAEKYEEVKRKKELHKLSEKYGKKFSILQNSEADNDEEDEEDDDAVLLTEENELAFANALLAVRKASAKAAATSLTEEPDLTKRFFPPAEEQIQHNTQVFQKALEKKKQRKFTLADEYRRTMQATAHGEGELDDEEGQKDNSGLRKVRPQTAEERRLRECFLKNVAESTSSFTVEKKPTEGLKGGDEDGQDKEQPALHRRILEEAFSVETDDKNRTRITEDEGDGEEFIRAFFLKELWKSDPADEADEGGPSLEQLAQEEADEAFYNDAEVWEREFQEKKYRHEELEENASHVPTFPRPIGDGVSGLLRKQNTSRKDARQRRQERIEAARQQQVEELKRLKHLKRQEIDEQRALIAAVAGISKRYRCGHPDDAESGTETRMASDTAEDAALLAKLQAVWSEKDLEADFDPVEFDKKMALLFDNEYYTEENVDEDEMAYFDAELDREGEIEGLVEGDVGVGVGDLRHPNALASEIVAQEPELFQEESLEDAMRMATSRDKKSSKNKAVKNGKGTSNLVEEEDVFFRDPFNSGPSQCSTEDPLTLLYPSSSLRQLEDASFQRRRELESMLEEHKGSKKGKVDEELVERLKAELKQKEEEYYQLHHDTTLDGGDVKTRFRYREVPAEDFTLSVEEILARDDRQLNMIAPMNCYAAYLDRWSNERDRRRIMRRRAKGMREVDADRSSRRYGNVKSTIVLDPNMDAKAGEEVVQRLRKRLRDEGGGDAKSDKWGLEQPMLGTKTGPGGHRGGGGHSYPFKDEHVHRGARGRGYASQGTSSSAFGGRGGRERRR